MKKRILSLLLALVLMASMPAVLSMSATMADPVVTKVAAPALGDINADGITDIADIVAVINAASGAALDPDEYPGQPDVTKDGVIDIADIVAVINIASGDTSTEPCFEVADVTANAGDTSVAVTVRFLNNPGILGTKLTLNYDDSVMTLKNAVNGDALSTLTYTKPGKYKDGCNFLWFGSESGGVADAVILTLVFDISDTAVKGTYPIAFTVSETYDSSYNPLTIDAVSGSITVE